MVIALAFVRRIGASRTIDLLAVGVLWLDLTLAFEILFGCFAVGASWERLAADHLILPIAKVRENMELTHDLNIQPRLDAMYEEMERLLDEFSKSAKKDGPASP